MAEINRAIGRHRDYPQIEAINLNSSSAGGSGTDYEHVVVNIPNLALFAGAGTVGDLPLNAQQVRNVSVIFEAALNGVATNNFTLNILQRRNGALLVNTTSATTITAGANVVVTPASMTNIVVGAYLYFSLGTGTAETVVVTAVTSTTFTATFANNHSSSYTITSAPLATVTYATTTSATTVVAGSNVVTPASMASIYVGSQLQFSGGTGATEVVLVTAVTATTFTATFVNGHSGGYTIAIAELAFVPHQFYVPMTSANSLLPGDIVTIQRISNGTGLASPALTVSVDLVPAGIGR